jgi:murein DD-endopeptidase MepM/ murein hydrolase activator NlpD
LLIFGLQSLLNEAKAQYGRDVAVDTLASTVLIHPPVAAPGERSVLFTREHTYRPNYTRGDQLARDFIVMTIGKDGIMRPFKPGSEGKRNEDWFTWRNDVLAPYSGTVAHVQQHDSTNQPGRLNSAAQHGQIQFKNEEDVVVSYVHLREIKVKEGQRVKVGEVVAKAGNNGSSIAPHVHVGAWKDNMPLQIQVDLYAKERYSGEEDKE